MELQQNRGLGPFIKSYEAGESFIVDDQTYQSSIAVRAEKGVELWAPQTLAELNEAGLQALLESAPGLIILGVGRELVFPEAKLLAPIYAANVGIEIMDTAAACRTYNVLMSESRDVLAALLL